MLQAYIDDSAAEGTQPVFLLGGYIGTADTWARFSYEWQRALDMKPRLRYFKFREALRAEGEFNGVSEALRMERAGIMRGVIELFPLSCFSIEFRVDHLQKTHANAPKRWLNPYYTAVSALMPSLARAHEDLGLPREPIDITFDNQVMEKVEVISAWEDLRRFFLDNPEKPDPPDLFTNILKNSPRWADDEDVLPLQAADMHITWCRLRIEAARDGREVKPMPNARVGHKQVTFTLNRAFFEARAARIAAAMKTGEEED